jgi:pyridoxine kinase
VQFDAVLVGYLSDPEQAEAVAQILEAFPCPMILDPVMGDHGKLYQGITQSHVEAMQDLSCLANVLLPNVTEAALLTGLPYREDADTAYLRELAQGVLSFGAETVIITGFTRPNGQTGFFGMARSGETFPYQAQRIGKHFHGTGDLFAAAFTGALMAEKTAPEAATLAARFTERVIAATEESTPFGIAFEPELGWLLEQL